jgi:hypothetical protein
MPAIHKRGTAGAIAAVMLFVSYLTVAAYRGMIAIPIPSAFAPSAAFRCPDAGTVFQYNGSRLASRGEDGFMCRFDTDATHGTEWFGGIMPAMDRGDTLGRTIVRKLWPLHAGTQFEWEYTDEEGRPTKANLSVVGYRLIHVPAGWFFAFEIEKSHVRPDYQYTVTHWWAPGLSWNIRQSLRQYCAGPLPFGVLWSLIEVSREAPVPTRKPTLDAALKSAPHT